MSDSWRMVIEDIGVVSVTITEPMGDRPLHYFMAEVSIEGRTWDAQSRDNREDGREAVGHLVATLTVAGYRVQEILAPGELSAFEQVAAERHRSAEIVRALVGSFPKCQWDYDEETGEGGCNEPRTHYVEGPHNEPCGEYCEPHAREEREHHCSPPHRYRVFPRAGAEQLVAALRSIEGGSRE